VPLRSRNAHLVIVGGPSQSPVGTSSIRSGVHLPSGNAGVETVHQACRHGHMRPFRQPALQAASDSRSHFVANAIGFAAAGFLLEALGPRGLYALCGAVGLVASVLVYRLFVALRDREAAVALGSAQRCA
jgi:hypothetical protein